MKEQLLKLKETIENIEITYNIDDSYCNLRNATIDFDNETQEWLFDELFIDFVDEYLLSDLIKYKLDNEGLWSVQNLLGDIDNYNFIYYVDAYGYGHDVTTDKLKELKQDILKIINDNLEDD